MNTKQETTLKIERNLEALLCYILCWVSGIFFLIVEKKNDFVRFHAYQSTIVFLSLLILRLVLGVIPAIGPLVSTIILFVTIILWILLMYKAFNGEEFALPLAGELASKMAGRATEDSKE